MADFTQIHNRNRFYFDQLIKALSSIFLNEKDLMRWELGMGIVDRHQLILTFGGTSARVGLKQTIH
jgi:hypothetical protein